MLSKKHILIVFLLFLSNLSNIQTATNEEDKDIKIEIKLVWQKSIERIGFDPFFPNWPILIDVNHDNKLDMIIRPGDRGFVILSHKGDVLYDLYWNEEFLDMDMSDYASPIVCDIDSDGNLEYIVVGDIPPDVNDIIIIFDLERLEIDRVIWTKDRIPGAVITGFLHGDYDADGCPELLVSTSKGLYIYDYEEDSFVFLIHETGIDGYYVEGPIYPLYEDRIVFLNYPFPDTCVGVYDLSENRVLWVRNLSSIGTLTARKLWIGDFDDDCVKEIVALGFLPEIWILNELGALEAYFNFTSLIGRWYGSDAGGFADLDNDGVIEGIFPFSSGLSLNYSADGIIAFIRMGDYYYYLRSYLDWPTFWHPIDYSTLSIVDFDLDGLYDLLVFNYGNLTILKSGHQILFTYNISSFFLDHEDNGLGFIWGDTRNRFIVMDIDNDGYVEIINCYGLSVAVFRLIVKPFMRPLVYWNPIDGWFWSYGVFERVDNDHDRVADWVEAKLGLRNDTWDSDGDGVSDLEEALEYFRRPKINMLEYVILYSSLAMIGIAAVVIVLWLHKRKIRKRPQYVIEVIPDFY